MHQAIQLPAHYLSPPKSVLNSVKLVLRSEGSYTQISPSSVTFRHDSSDFRWIGRIRNQKGPDSVSIRHVFRISFFSFFLNFFFCCCRLLLFCFLLMKLGPFAKYKTKLLTFGCYNVQVCLLKPATDSSSCVTSLTFYQFHMYISNNCSIEREFTLLFGKRDKSTLWCALPRGPTHPHTHIIMG